VDGEANTFKLDVTETMLRPFYKILDKRYSVYWDILTVEEMMALQEADQMKFERRQKIESLTHDYVQPGDQLSEKEHNFQGENAPLRRFKERSHRESRGGWFSYDLKVQPNSPNSILVEYWGGFPGSKTFDILIDGVKLVTENISLKKDGQFIFEEYALPEEMTRGKDKITIRFEAHEGHIAGPVFGVRTILSASERK
jgi:hypothetical protein